MPKVSVIYIALGKVKRKGFSFIIDDEEFASIPQERLPNIPKQSTPLNCGNNISIGLTSDAMVAIYSALKYTTTQGLTAKYYKFVL